MSQDKTKQKVTFMKDEGLAEIMQTVEIRFAFANKELLQCCPFVKCRDFLSDALVHVAQGCPPISIYGFHYDKKIRPILELDETIMLVELPSNVEDDAIPRAVELLARCEKLAGAESVTTAEKVTGWKNRTYLLRSPKMWSESPTMVSAYTSLIRLCERTFDPLAGEFEAMLIDAAGIKGDNDGKYIGAAAPIMEKLLTKDCDKISFDNVDYAKYNTSTIHNYTGIYSWAKKITPMQKEKAA